MTGLRGIICSVSARNRVGLDCGKFLNGGIHGFELGRIGRKDFVIGLRGSAVRAILTVDSNGKHLTSKGAFVVNGRGT